jgi:hypothetical protein
MRRLIVLALALAAMGFIACAQGTSDGPSGNHPDAHVGTGTDFADAPTSSTPDAFEPVPDAFAPADANVPTPDAPGSGTGSALFCNSDNDCDVASGQCCFEISGPPGVCIPKDPAGLCLPI